MDVDESEQGVGSNIGSNNVDNLEDNLDNSEDENTEEHDGDLNTGDSQSEDLHQGEQTDDTQDEFLESHENKLDADDTNIEETTNDSDQNTNDLDQNTNENTNDLDQNTNDSDQNTNDLDQNDLDQNINDIDQNDLDRNTNDSENESNPNSETEDDSEESSQPSKRQKLDNLSSRLNENIEEDVQHISDDDVEEIQDSDNETDKKTKNNIKLVKPARLGKGSGAQANGTTDNTIVLNDSGEELDVPKENGSVHSAKDDDDVIALDTPEKKKSVKPDVDILSPPRRSSRNLNKSKSYSEYDKDDEVIERKSQDDEESDIEEVLPQDPLDVGEPQSNKNKRPKSGPSTIVVKDTKRLVEIASKSNPNTSGKKEPTLVIIDTNSILSGRGPIPLSSKSTPSQSYQSLLPAAVPAQGVYPPNMRATITPIPMNSSISLNPALSINSISSNLSTSPSVSILNSPSVNITPTKPVAASTPQQAPILPSLTDDMFVVEAPSFIVPYVYEKPPVKDLKKYVEEMLKELKEIARREEENERKEAEKNGEDTKDSESDKKDKTDTDEKKDDMKDDVECIDDTEVKKSNYFESPLGKFFIDIGTNLVQEFVQTDLLKQQKKKREREGGQNSVTNRTIQTLLKNLEYSKENNEPFKMEIKKCEFCSFKTESALAMAFHLETPHMKNYVYRCNFCPFEVRSPHDILFHMEAEHAVRGRLERAPAFHQCPNCPFEDNQKGKLSRHAIACSRKFKPERNLEAPFEWEPPAKIPRAPKVTKPQQQMMNAAAMYQMASKSSQYQMMSKMQAANVVMNRGRGRPSMSSVRPPILRPSGGMTFKQMSGGSVLVPANYQMSGTQLYQVNFKILYFTDLCLVADRLYVIST